MITTVIGVRVPNDMTKATAAVVPHLDPNGASLHRCIIENVTANGGFVFLLEEHAGVRRGDWIQHATEAHYARILVPVPLAPQARNCVLCSGDRNASFNVFCLYSMER